MRGRLNDIIFLFFEEELSMLYVNRDFRYEHEVI